MLEEALGVQAQSLPPQEEGRAPMLAHLEAWLFRVGARQSVSVLPTPNAPAGVELVAAPDRASEARAALRWLKARVVQDGMPIHEVALLARD